MVFVGGLSSYACIPCLFLSAPTKLTHRLQGRNLFPPVASSHLAIGGPGVKIRQIATGASGGREGNRWRGNYVFYQSSPPRHLSRRKWVEPTQKITRNPKFRLKVPQNLKSFPKQNFLNIKNCQKCPPGFPKMSPGISQIPQIMRSEDSGVAIP